MKSLLLFIATFIVAGQLVANTIQPGVRSTFHAVDEQGRPISEELVEVEVTFARTDANGNKVPVYSEKFTEKTTKDGYFQREIGKTSGDLPTVTFGKYDDVDFKDSTLCVRVDFRRIEINNPQWIIGNWSMLNPVPVASHALNTTDADDADKDETNELQELSKDGNTVSLSRDGGSVELNDDDPTNELQILSYDEDTKTLHLEGGSTVDLSSLQQLMENGNVLCTDKVLQATQFTTKTDAPTSKVARSASVMTMGLIQTELKWVWIMRRECHSFHSLMMKEISLVSSGWARMDLNTIKTRKLLLWIYGRLHAGRCVAFFICNAGCVISLCGFSLTFHGLYGYRSHDDILGTHGAQGPGVSGQSVVYGTARRTRAAQ